MAAPADGIQYPYPAFLYLSVSEHIKLYNKEISGLPERDRYDLTTYKWTEFYQELEDYVSTFWFRASVLIVTAIDAHNSPNEVKEIILSYPSITQVMV